MREHIRGIIVGDIITYQVPASGLTISWVVVDIQDQRKRLNVTLRTVRQTSPSKKGICHTLEGRGMSPTAEVAADNHQTSMAFLKHGVETGALTVGRQHIREKGGRGVSVPPTLGLRTTLS